MEGISGALFRYLQRTSHSPRKTLHLCVCISTPLWIEVPAKRIQSSRKKAQKWRWNAYLWPLSSQLSREPLHYTFFRFYLTPPASVSVYLPHPFSFHSIFLFWRDPELCSRKICRSFFPTVFLSFIASSHVISTKRTSGLFCPCKEIKRWLKQTVSLDTQCLLTLDFFPWKSLKQREEKIRKEGFAWTIVFDVCLTFERIKRCQRFVIVRPLQRFPGRESLQEGGGLWFSRTFQLNDKL